MSDDNKKQGLAIGPVAPAEENPPAAAPVAPAEENPRQGNIFKKLGQLLSFLTLGLRMKLGQWLFFTVIIALLPIVLDAFRKITTSTDTNLSIWSWHFISDLISHGDLALICAAVTAEAIGHIFVSGHTKWCIR